MDEEELYEKSVDDLFSNLGEIDKAQHAPQPSIPGLIETLHEEEGRLDSWRVTMVHFAQALSVFVRTAMSEPGEDDEEVLRRLSELLEKISRMPEHQGRILVRHRGRGFADRGRESQFYDYCIYCGPLHMDLLRVEQAAERLGSGASHLPESFLEATRTLANCGVNTFYVGLRVKEGQEDPFEVEPTLEALRAYFSTASGLPDMEGAEEGEASGPQVIYDEKRKPNPNFTALAAVNTLRKGTIQVLINQVDAMMHRAGVRDPLRCYTSAYNAIFAFKKLYGVLKRPPMEINNSRWCLASHEDEALTETQAYIARLVSRDFGEWSQKAARILVNLYAHDYSSLLPWQLVERLGRLTELLEAIEISLSGRTDLSSPSEIIGEWAVDDVLELVKNGLERVQDEVYDQIAVEGDTISALTGVGDESSRRYVDSRILEMIAFYRQRSVTNKKMKSLLRHAADFDTADYTNISQDFDVSIEAAVELVGLLSKCFDTSGHFIRKSFEKSIPAFCRHEKKVFEFLWYYLKEHMAMEDRIALLNSLQLLINRMRRPESALGVLLEGFALDPRSVTYSERNALMLCNVLIRKFNKELLKDIKMTPEEVLHVHDGLDHQATAFVRQWVASNKEDFLLKVRTIHRHLKAGLNPYAWHDAMPLGYMLTMEREVYILLSLVGGDVASAVLRSALWEYGNPSSEIYRLVERRDQLQWLFHILQVIIRGVGRVGKKLDVALLGDVCARQSEFMALALDAATREQIKRFTIWAERSQKSLEFKANSK